MPSTEPTLTPVYPTPGEHQTPPPAEIPPAPESASPVPSVNQPSRFTPATRLVLGLATLVPAATLTVMAIGRATGTLSEGFMLAAGLFILLMCFALGMFYVPYAVANRHLRPLTKAMWASVLILLAPLAMPLYWIVFVSRDPQP